MNSLRPKRAFLRKIALFPALFPRSTCYIDFKGGAVPLLSSAGLCDRLGIVRGDERSGGKQGAQKQCPLVLGIVGCDLRLMICYMVSCLFVFLFVFAHPSSVVSCLIW